MVCVLVGEGFKMMKGWNVNVDAKSVHLDPTVYSDPNKFNPSRFDVRITRSPALLIELNCFNEN